jgi:hypothetical protein
MFVLHAVYRCSWKLMRPRCGYILSVRWPQLPLPVLLNFFRIKFYVNLVFTVSMRRRWLTTDNSWTELRSQTPFSFNSIFSSLLLPHLDVSIENILLCLFRVFFWVHHRQSSHSLSLLNWCYKLSFLPFLTLIYRLFSRWRALFDFWI